MTEPNNSGGPVTASERIVTLDALRGFALLGILLVNIAFFTHPVSDAFNQSANTGAADNLVAWLTGLFAQGKFYPLFSLLFGLGFAVQLDRARAGDRSFMPTYLRRLLVLLAIGVAHGVFIWAGDILTTYALLGFLLLALGLGRPRLLLVFAIVAYVLQILLAGATTLSFQTLDACQPLLQSEAPETVEIDPSLREACQSPGIQGMAKGMGETMAELTALQEAAWSAYAEGSYVEATQIRAQEFGMMLSNVGFFGLQVLAMFLFGAWLGRSGHFAAVREHRTFFRNALIAAVLVGVPLSWWFANLNLSIDYDNMLDPNMMLAFLVNLFAGPLLALGYASVFALGMQTRLARILSVLAPVGRMALTNYLAQSVICTLLFYGYGLGLMNERFGAASLLGVVIGVYLLEVLWSHWWMKRFAFGPAEWLWRSLTYFRRPRMRIAAS